MKKNCLELKRRGMSYMKYVNGKITGIAPFAHKLSSISGYCGKVKRRDTSDGDEEEDVESYWMTLRKGEDILI
jgi:hypothetical protein